MGSGLTNVRVKKLARQLGKPLPKLIQVLRQMGLEQYAHADAVLPAERLTAVRQAMASPPTDPDFDSLMHSLGVRPLSETHETPSGRYRTPKSRYLQNQPTARPTPKPTPSRPAAAPDRTQDLQDALGTVQASLSKITRQLNQEKQARQQAQQEALQLRKRLVDTSNRLAQSKSQVVALQSQLDSPAGGNAALLSLLQQRGLNGLTEAESAITALLTSRRFAAVISELAIPRRDRFEALLRDHLVLHCGLPQCPPPMGPVAVTVSSERCEICGGLGLLGPLQGFADALLLNGLTRVGIQGGHPNLLRQLEALLDRRIQLRFLGQGLMRAETVPQVLIRWLPGDRAPTRVEDVLLSTDTTLSAMLLSVAERINRR